MAPSMATPGRGGTAPKPLNMRGGASGAGGAISQQARTATAASPPQLNVPGMSSFGGNRASVTQSPFQFAGAQPQFPAPRMPQFKTSSAGLEKFSFIGSLAKKGWRAGVSGIDKGMGWVGSQAAGVVGRVPTRVKVLGAGTGATMFGHNELRRYGENAHRVLSSMPRARDAARDARQMNWAYGSNPQVPQQMPQGSPQW